MEDIFDININYIEDVEIKELYIMEIYDNEILDLFKFKFILNFVKITQNIFTNIVPIIIFYCSFFNPKKFFKRFK